MLSAQLQREVQIDPPFSIHLRRSIPIKVGGVRIARARLERPAALCSRREHRGRYRLGGVAGRQPVLHRLSVARPIFVRNGMPKAARPGRWARRRRPRPRMSGPMLPVIEQLSIGEANIGFKDAANRIDMQIRASASHNAAATGADAAAGGLVATGDGKWRDEPVQIEVRTKGLQPVLEGGALKDLEVKAKLKSTDISFNGSVSALAATSDVAGTISAAGPSLAELTVIPGLDVAVDARLPPRRRPAPLGFIDQRRRATRRSRLEQHDGQAGVRRQRLDAAAARLPQREPACSCRTSARRSVRPAKVRIRPVLRSAGARQPSRVGRAKAPSKPGTPRTSRVPANGKNAKGAKERQRWQGRRPRTPRQERQG